MMTDFGFLNVIERYGVDTVLVSLFVVFCIRLLKKTLLKNRADMPIIPFLPFIFGVAAFAVVQCILHPSWEYLWQNLREIVEGGLTVGCLSALENAVISRLCGKSSLPDRAAIVRELLTGVAEGEELDGLSVQIANCVSEEYSAEDAARVAAALCAFAGENASESEMKALAELIVKTLKTTAV